MVELPEAVTLAKQLNKTIRGKTITQVIAAQSPHKFAWYQGDPAQYPSLLKQKKISSAAAVGHMVEIHAEEACIVLSEGIGLRYHQEDTGLPKKHQLFIEFDDAAYLTVSIQMYGGILCFKNGECDNEYYLTAQKKPSPYADAFDQNYFLDLISAADLEQKSAKFILATEQRIPGFGNGVLQDVLFTAKIHPKRKMGTLTAEEKSTLFRSLKNVLYEMADEGGRDTEKDLFGNPGGYKTLMSKNSAGQPCPACGTTIQKLSYMGGSVYVCSSCQRE